jgi:hypothetical protein
MLICMRTTLDLDSALLQRAKEMALRTGRTLTSVVEDALRASLAQRDQPAPEPVRLPTAPGKPRPGIDLDDTAFLLDMLEEDARL